MEKFSHRHVVKLYSSFYANNDMEMFVIMELCDCDLETLIENRKGEKIPIDTVLEYCCQILSGVKYLHGQNVTHRDIKPQVLFNSWWNEVTIYFQFVCFSRIFLFRMAKF